LLLGFFILPHKSSNCQEQYRNDSRLKIGNSTIDVQIATSAAEQTKGLGGRSCLGADQGMLFVFDKPGAYPFWMRDMKFPIDIVWIDKNNAVVDLQKDIQPSTYPQSYTNQTPAKKVLELPAGQADSLNIRTGTKIN
jgi:uncharacterized membrane protein (UPF0127 family)